MTTERWQHPAPGKAKIIHIDVDPGVMGANYRPDAAIVGDARLSLASLLNAVEERESGGAKNWSHARRQHGEFRELAKLRSADRPERIVDTMQRVLPRRGRCCRPAHRAHFSAYYQSRETGRSFIRIGARRLVLPCRPWWAPIMGDRVECVAVMGDGSFRMAVGERDDSAAWHPRHNGCHLEQRFRLIKAAESGYDGRYFSPISRAPTTPRSPRLWDQDLDRPGAR